jgi:hypothetical protein
VADPPALTSATKSVHVPAADNPVKELSTNCIKYTNVLLLASSGAFWQGVASVQRLQTRYPRLQLVHGPVHGSWINQIEVYFSIIQRKALTPNDFQSLDEVAHALWQFERHLETIARPFEWKFTRSDLNELLTKLATPKTTDLAVAA